MSSTADIDKQIEQLKRCEYIKESEVKALCNKAKEILMQESNVQRVDSPITVTGMPLTRADLRRHSRPVLRPHGALQGGW